MVAAAYLTRIIDPLLAEVLAGLPAVLIAGPRGTGKTTTARRVGGALLRLDRPAEAGVVRADPDAAVAGLVEPVVIDEWPLVPEVLGAVKRAVDDDPRPGRFVLTGSAGADLTAAGWPATGRVVRIPLWGLTVREQLGDAAARPFLDRLATGVMEEVSVSGVAPDLREYVEFTLRGGFPEVALQPSARLRSLWLASWVDQVVARDLPAAGGGRNPVQLRRYLQVVAANTAGVVQHQTMYRAAGVNRLTAIAYETVLETRFVTERLPAWVSNRLDRLTKTPKRHLVEPALMGPLLGVDARAAMRDIDLLGRLLESFVVAQLRAELAVAAGAPRLFHLRQADGRHEIDVIIERADGSVIAIEVKATASPRAGDASHLRWLRDRLGDQLVAAALLHTGPRTFRLDPGILAVPIAALWA